MMVKTKKLSDDVDDDFILKTLNNFKGLNLSSHYDFEETTTCSLVDSKKIADFMATNKPLLFRVSDDNVLYFKTSSDDEEQLFDIDVTKSFVKTDIWLYDKLIKVVDIFPNASSSNISDEMTGFYVCLVIASVFGDEFEVEFIEVVNGYSFAKWEKSDDSDFNFSSLATSWIQIGSRFIKMVAAAAKYALLREKRKKHVPSALQLPQETVLELNKCIRTVDAIRHDYDIIKLRPSEREKMTKLEIKVMIKERDDAIELALKNDNKIYQIWRLLNFNSNVIPPVTLLKINRQSKRDALGLFKSIRGEEENPKTREDKLELKKVENLLKKAVKRAFLNKLFDSESKKFIDNPDMYVAPDFV